MQQQRVSNALGVASEGYLERTTDIVKPDTDDREYCYVMLSNKMRVLLVRDLEAPKAAAALSLNIGELLRVALFPDNGHLVKCE